MARYTIDELKRLNICPILSKNKWDYIKKGTDVSSSYLYGIKEMFRWYYRRRKRISPDAISASVSHHAFQSGLSFEAKADLETAFRKFAFSPSYRELEQPYYNYEIEMQLGKTGNILSHTIPVLSKHKKSVYVFSLGLGKVSEDLFLNRYETLAVAFWSFYSLDKVPVFMNLYFDGKRIVEQKIKVNMEYIKKAKESVIKISEKINQECFIPPSEVCHNCNRRDECPNLLVVSQLQKK